MKRPNEPSDHQAERAAETPDFDRAAEHVLRKNQELYKRLAHPTDLGEAEQAFSEVRRQYRNALKRLAE